MRRAARSRIAPPLIALALLAGCSAQKSTSEDRQLDDAAASLEANSADANTAEIVEINEEDP